MTDLQTRLREQIEGIRADFQRKCRQHQQDHEYTTTSQERRVYVGSSETTMNIFADLREDYSNRIAPLQEELARLEGRFVPEKKIETEAQRLIQEHEAREYSDWVERMVTNHGG